MTMRVGIQGWGSEGDLRPLVALAARLRSEGHWPRLVLTSVEGKDYAQLCRALDVPLRVVPSTTKSRCTGVRCRPYVRAAEAPGAAVESPAFASR